MRRKLFGGGAIFAALIALVALWPGHIVHAQKGNILHAQNGNAVTLTWNAPSTGGAATSYNVKRGTSSGTEATIGTVAVPTTTYVDSTGTPGATYFYVVTAVNSGGESTPSNEVSATFLVSPPGPPSGLAAASN